MPSRVVQQLWLVRLRQAVTCLHVTQLGRCILAEHLHIQLICPTCLRRLDVVWNDRRANVSARLGVELPRVLELPAEGLVGDPEVGYGPEANPLLCSALDAELLLDSMLTIL